MSNITLINQVSENKVNAFLYIITRKGHNYSVVSTLLLISILLYLSIGPPTVNDTESMLFVTYV